MTIREFGKERNETLLFFPRSCEPWQEFAPAAKSQARMFHVILVTPNGHDLDNHNDFISVKKTVDDTALWLKQHNIDHLNALYGLSFGGGMVLRLLVIQNIPIDKSIIDAGTASYVYPKWACKLIGVRDFLMMKMTISFFCTLKTVFPPERFARNPENWKQ